VTHSKRSKALEKVYSAKNNSELSEGYDAWAENYDSDVLSFGYKIPAIITGLIGRYISPNIDSILDAGVGTGILGETLITLGYKNPVGIDLSQGMLEMAHKKGIYRNLHRMTLGEHLDFPDNTFAGTASMGVFTLGHAPPESFDELIRITQPGGHIIFSVRTDVYLEKGFKEKQEILEVEGKWRLIEKSKPFQGIPTEDSEIYNQIFVYRVC